MNKERLSRLITQYQKNLEFYRNAREFNEQDCRDEFISPLLESFGWDVHNEKGTSPQYKEVVEKYSRGQKDYIEFGEKNGENTGYKCKIREKWYQIPSVWVPDAFFLRRNNLYQK